MRKIVTSHEYPPISDRRFDWGAYYEGQEEGGFQGWGSTEAEAIADLMEQTADDPADAYANAAQPVYRKDGRQ